MSRRRRWPEDRTLLEDPVGLTPQERQILSDYDRAKNHADKYALKFLAQMQARGLMLESAVRK